MSFRVEKENRYELIFKAFATYPVPFSGVVESDAWRRRSLRIWEKKGLKARQDTYIHTRVAKKKTSCVMNDGLERRQEEPNKLQTCFHHFTIFLNFSSSETSNPFYSIIAMTRWVMHFRGNSISSVHTELKQNWLSSRKWRKACTVKSHNYVS